MRLTDTVRALRRVPIQDAVIAVALALYWLSLTAFPRVWNRWPLRSHYYYQNKHLLSSLGWHVLPLLMTLAALVLLTWRRTKATPRVLLLLFACALSLQWSLSLLEGVGARRLSSTLLSVQYGHSEFVRLAFAEQRPLDLARDYEERCTAAEPRSYTQSKPPGHLLFYALAARVYHLLHVESLCAWLATRASFEQRDPFTAFGAFATVVFSLVSCLPVIAFSRLGARLEGSAAGAYYGLVFLLCPAVNLITMHLDQVLYPLCVVLALLAAVAALQKHPAFGALTALIVYAAVYVSFSLLFLVPTVGLWWAAHLLLQRETRRKALLTGAYFVAGALASYALFRWGLGFELLRAYGRSMAHHAAWRDTPGIVALRGTARNLAEAAFWLGIPAVVLCAAQWLRSGRQLLRRSPSPAELFVLLYPLIVIGVSTFGHAVREIGRLWIPLLIPAQLAAAREVNRLYERRPTTFVLFSGLAILLRKNYHDFR